MSDATPGNHGHALKNGPNACAKVRWWRDAQLQSSPSVISEQVLTSCLRDAGIEELSHRTVAGIQTPRIEHQTGDAKPAAPTNRPPAPSGARPDRRGTHFSIHGNPVGTVLQALEMLGLGASLIESAQASAASPPDPVSTGDANEARTLWLLLTINALMFAIELVTGLLAQSAGLIADSLDMFADAAVYGVSLYAVGRTAGMKLRAAHFAGWLQLTLAVGVLAEVTMLTRIARCWACACPSRRCAGWPTRC